MYNKVKITLDSDKVIDITILVVLIHLYYAKINFISSSGHKSHSESHRIDQYVCISSHRVRINEVSLNHALEVHEKLIHSSFQSDFLISRSVQAVYMALFPKLDLDCPTFYACKINRIIPVPGESKRTTHILRLVRNIIKVGPE